MPLILDGQPLQTQTQTQTTLETPLAATTRTGRELGKNTGIMVREASLTREARVLILPGCFYAGQKST